MSIGVLSVAVFRIRPLYRSNGRPLENVRTVTDVVGDDTLIPRPHLSPTMTGSEGPIGRPCPLCEAPMERRHCKYVCPNHGVVYDCGDTFWV
jgi:hypothetical protein